MASEAQRLIGISLTKIAQSRTHRGGVSLHKNLLIATVLQKARYIFMEEAYNMVHYQQRAAAPVQQLHHHLQPAPLQQQVQLQMQPQTHAVNMQQRHQHADADEDDDLVGLTVEEAGIDQTAPAEDAPTSGCTKCAANQPADKDKNKENHQPLGYHAEPLTYLDLDKSPSVLKERSSANTGSSASPVCLKRRRAVSEWETEEAVQSILPKRRCASVEPILSADDDDCDSVFLDSATQLSETVSKQLEDAQTAATTTATAASPMDSIDRITSLVSIFSFGVTPSADGAATGNGKLTPNRAVSTPDLCSSQAKESDTIQQRPFLAMTV